MSAKPFSVSQPQQTCDSLLPESSLVDRVSDLCCSTFARDGYVSLPQLFSEQTFAMLQAEIARLKKHANVRNFTMPGYETLRRMSTLGGKEIRRQSPLLLELYDSFELRSLVSRICGREIFTCYDENEWQVINWLDGPGDTHGWHLDDPPLALVIFIEAPPPGQGGALEFLTGWPQLCAEIGSDPERDVQSIVDTCRAAGLVRSREHSIGDAYLLRADQCLHRAEPLRALGTRRAVLNMAFEFEPDVRRIGATAALLYETGETSEVPVNETYF